jgi:hypothetical protein
VSRDWLGDLGQLYERLHVALDGLQRASARAAIRRLREEAAVSGVELPVEVDDFQDAAPSGVLMREPTVAREESADSGPWSRFADLSTALDRARWSARSFVDERSALADLDAENR